MSGPAEIAALWECAVCGTALAGVLLRDQMGLHAKFVRLAQLHFDAETADLLPDNFRTEIFELVAKQGKLEHHEKRRSPRELRQLDAVAIGLDNNYMLVGPKCCSIVANLSSHGMLLTTAVQLTTPFVAVQMHGGNEVMQLLGKIVWSRHLGRSCYGAGIDFVARLGKVNPGSAASSTPGAV